MRHLQFVVTSDAHYGITRAAFRGRRNVDAHDVNAALVAAINQLPPLIGPIDFVVEMGDVTNRAEDNEDETVQPAPASWAQFVSDYVEGLTVRDANGMRSPLYVVPGNHEASNAVGYYERMTPPTDPTPLVAIYNMMIKPPVPMTAASFDYQRDRVFFTRDIAGLHLQFLHVWPDSVMRAKMEEDLSHVDAGTPVLVFTHDQPDVQSKHLTNPNGTHDINPRDKFENLLADVFASGPSIDVPSLKEQAQLEAFLVRHRNVTAYFHGNSNWHQVYDWNGPNKAARLRTVRVDSPMKGAVSATDETRLSFAVVTIDTATRSMRVRECLWNADPAHPDRAMAWGAETTMTLEPRPETLH